MGGVQKGSLQQKVLAAVLAGAVTIKEVLARVGRHIPASWAARVGGKAIAFDKKRHAARRKRPEITKEVTPARLVANGRRELVTRALNNLANDGKIARIARGRYGPLPPKLHDPAQAS